MVVSLFLIACTFCVHLTLLNIWMKEGELLLFLKKNSVCPVAVRESTFNYKLSVHMTCHQGLYISNLIIEEVV